jgi:hypothetical protein
MKNVYNIIDRYTSAAYLIISSGLLAEVTKAYIISSSRSRRVYIPNSLANFVSMYSNGYAIHSIIYDIVWIVLLVIFHVALSSAIIILYNSTILLYSVLSIAFPTRSKPNMVHPKSDMNVIGKKDVGIIFNKMTPLAIVINKVINVKRELC